MTTTETAEAPFGSWAIVELMGHRRLAGWVTEESRFGSPMLRIDIPGAGETRTTQYYGNQSIYCVTPTTEEIATAIAKRCQPAPVVACELPAPARPWDDDDGYPF